MLQPAYITNVMAKVPDTRPPAAGVDGCRLYEEY
jgi:hypothetical protein